MMHSCSLCGQSCTKIKRRIFDTRFGYSDEYDIYKCNHCDLVQAGIDPSNYDIQHIYESFYNYHSKQKALYERLREAFFFSPFYRFWVFIDGDISFHTRRGNGRLIDVGCNYGRNLRIYNNQGFVTEGIEINERSASTARKLGLRIHSGCLEDFNQQRLYDIVVLSNVIEHAVDPKQMLLSANRILKTGGKVWISTPNVESWQRFIFGRYWINWHVPFHFSFFSADTLTKLLKQTGYTRIQSTNRSPSLWMAQSILAAFFSKRGQPSHIQRSPLVLGALLILIRLVLFPLLATGNFFNRGDCIVIEAIKNKTISN